MEEMSKGLRRLLLYYLFILLVWVAFRYFISLPDVISELWFKPVIWLVPLFWWQISDEKHRIALFRGDINKTLFWGLGLGLFYYSLVKLITKTAWFDLDFNRLGIGLATAVVEEVTFAGIILSRLVSFSKKEGASLAVMALMYSLIRLPINLFVFKLSLVSLLGTMGLAFFIGVVNGFSRLKADNTLAAIMAHFFYLQAVL